MIAPRQNPPASPAPRHDSPEPPERLDAHPIILVGSAGDAQALRQPKT